MLTNLLFYRFLIVNLLFAGGGVYAWNAGWAARLFAGDTTHLTLGIAILFAVAWGWTAREIIAACGMRNAARAAETWTGLYVPDMTPTPTAPVKGTPAMRDKDMAKVAWLSSASEWLVGLGLLGTVIGFGMALSGIDTDSLSSANGVSGSVEALMRGMRVALNTTIAGTVFGMWTEVNVRMLKTALEIHWADAIDRTGG